jgi:hypothetical protein
MSFVDVRNPASLLNHDSRIDDEAIVCTSPFVPVKENPAGVSDEVARTIDKNTARLLGNENFLKKDGSSNEEKISDQNITNAQREINRTQTQEEENISEERIPIIIPEEHDEQEILKKIQTEMGKRGISITIEEAKILRESNFKTKFPWIMLSVTLAKWAEEIELTFVGFTLWVAGFAPTAILSAIPGLGTLVGFLISATLGAPVEIAGLVITILAFIINVIYKIIIFLWGIYYGQNALDFSNRIGFFRRVGYRFMIRRVWVFLFGSIPLLGGLLDTIMVFLIYFHMKKICNDAREVVKGV